MDDIFLKKKQVAMHKDLFIKCQNAIDNGAYLEAMLLEYAALESRLEVLLGVLGCPCGLQASTEERQSMNISHRIVCLNYIVKNAELFNFTRNPIDKEIFSDTGLDKWRDERNSYIHSFFKDANLYESRKKESERIAKEGLEYCRIIYRLTNRIKYQKKYHPEKFKDDKICCIKKECKLNPKQKNKQTKKTTIKFVKLDGFNNCSSSEVANIILQSDYFKNGKIQKIKKNGIIGFLENTQRKDTDNFNCEINDASYLELVNLITELAKYQVLVAIKYSL